MKLETSPEWVCDMCGYKIKNSDLPGDWETLCIARVNKKLPLLRASDYFHICNKCLPYGKGWDQIYMIWNKIFKWFWEKRK